MALITITINTETLHVSRRTLVRCGLLVVIAVTAGCAILPLCYLILRSDLQIVIAALMCLVMPIGYASFKTVLKILLTLSAIATTHYICLCVAIASITFVKLDEQAQASRDRHFIGMAVSSSVVVALFFVLLYKFMVFLYHRW